MLLLLASDAEKIWMRCKDYFRAQMFFERLSLGSYPEQRCDERRLPSCITPR
jgi:hypothetical protein